MKKYVLVIFALSLTILFSCYVAPKPVFRLKPVAENKIWLFGKEYVTSCNDSVEVALAFDRVIGANYVFKVEIINKTGRKILIQPEKNFYIAEIAQVKGVRTDTVWAIGPEDEILKIDRKMSSAFASYKSNQETYSFLSVLDLVSDVATANKKKRRGQMEAERLDDLQQEMVELNNEVRYGKKFSSLNEIRNEWECRALRKTTLPGGLGMQGRIYFPAYPGAKSIEIRLVVDGYEFAQKFHQITENL